MNSKLQSILDKEKIMVIDGSMSTALENMGLDLNDPLWTAIALANEPDKVRQVHYNYFKAGADCSISCSYQATIPGFMNKGYSEAEAEKLIRRSAEMLLEARSDFMAKEAGPDRLEPLALAGIGPYGAYLADGSEYTGNYGVSDSVLKDFHRRRMEIMAEAGCDILLIETQPSLKEAVLAAEIAEDIGIDFWVSFSCKDGKHIHEGELIADCAKELSAFPHINMIGVNCVPPVFVNSLIYELKSASDIPVACYPNSGETYHADTKTWSGSGMTKSYKDMALEWMRSGAVAVGGCCRTVEKHVEQVVEARKQFCKYPVIR